MKRLLAVSTAAAALMFATAAVAQDAQLYVTQDASGNRMIMGGTTAEGAPLLRADGDTAPADCPEGGYWEDSRQMVHACVGDDRPFLLRAPDTGAMMPDGQPYPENTMLMVREGTEDSGGTGAPSGENTDSDPAGGQNQNQGGGGGSGGQNQNQGGGNGSGGQNSGGSGSGG